MDEEAYRKKIDLIRHYQDIDSNENTRLTCLDALKDDPHDEWVLSVLTRVYYQSRDYDACINTGLEALQYQTPYKQAFVYNLLSAAYYKKDNFATAAEFSQKAMECDPNSASNMATHAKNLAHLKRLKEARELFRRAAELDPQNYYVLRDEYQFYRDFYKDRKAEEELLSRLVLLSTDPYDLNWQFALFHNKYREYREAHDYFVKALLLRPGSEVCREWVEYCEQMLKLGHN